MSSAPAPHTRRRPAGWTRTAVAVLALGLGLAAALAGCNSLFFQPNRVAYFFPPQFGLRSQDVFFKSRDGTQLTGWFLPAQGQTRGTIVYFHGNGANITNHLLQVRWLPPAGYSVLLWDYRGYGVSSGEPSREGLIEDGVAAIDYVRTRSDVDPQRLVVLGQSLGGAVAISALARAGTKGVRALVVEGGFGSYRDEVRTFMNAHWFTWPFQYPVAWLFFSDDHRPYDALPKLASVPFLVITSTGDQTVPLVNGKRLFHAFPGPDKTLWVVKGMPHVTAFVSDDSPWRARLVHYLQSKLGPPPGKDSKGARSQVRALTAPPALATSQPVSRMLQCPPTCGGP